MVKFFTSFALLGLLGAAVAQTTFDQEASLRDSGCDNDCFFGSFPGGSCSDDAACMCNQHKYRERYFCCMAEKCLPHVVLRSIQRQFLGCEAHGVPFAESPDAFDIERVCGVKLAIAGSTTTAPAGSVVTPASDSLQSGEETVYVTVTDFTVTHFTVTEDLASPSDTVSALPSPTSGAIGGMKGTTSMRMLQGTVVLGVAGWLFV